MCPVHYPDFSEIQNYRCNKEIKFYKKNIKNEGLRFIKEKYLIVLEIE